MDIGHDGGPGERGQALARIALPIALLLLGGYILQEFLRSLLWAAILAIAVGPLYARTRARLAGSADGGHDILLPLLFTLAATAIVLVPLGLLAAQLAREAGSAMHWLAQLRSDGLPPPGWLLSLPFGAAADAWWRDHLADPEAARSLLAHVDRLAPVQLGRQLGAAVLRRAVEFIVTVLTLFFLFREGPNLARKALYAIRRLFGPHGEPIARQIVASIHGTVDGLVLVGLGIGAVLGIGYVIAGAPHPAMLGFATAIAAVIPMGAPIMLFVAAGLVLAAGKTVAAIALAAGGMAIIFVADHAIRPALIGGATRLPFLWVLLGTLGGVATLGLLGLFLGPAVMSALILLWREWTKDATTQPQE